MELGSRIVGSSSRWLIVRSRRVVVPGLAKSFAVQMAKSLPSGGAFAATIRRARILKIDQRRLQEGVQVGLFDPIGTANPKGRKAARFDEVVGSAEAKPQVRGDLPHRQEVGGQFGGHVWQEEEIGPAAGLSQPGSSRRGGKACANALAAGRP